MSRTREPSKSMSTDKSSTQNQSRQRQSPENAAPIEEVVEMLTGGDVTQLSRSDVLQLQRQFGNRATTAMLRENGADTGPVAPPVFFKGASAAPAGRIQRKTGDGGGSNDGGGGGGGNDADAEKTPQDIAAANEVDGDDKDVKEQDTELKGTVQEANDVMAAAKRALDGTGPEKTVATQVLIDDEDADSQADDDIANANGNTAITGGAPKGQLPGTQVGGNQLGAEGKLTTAAKGTVNTVRAGGTALNFVEAQEAISDAVALSKKAKGVDVASDADAPGALGALQKVGEVLDTPPINVILSVTTLLPRIHLARAKFKQMNAYKKMMENNDGDTKRGRDQSKDVQSVGMLGAYGYTKTRRGFWLRFSKAIINVGQLLTRIVSIVAGAATAGAAAIVSEAVDAAMSLSQGVINVAQSLKALYKIVRGSRGKRRLQGANFAIERAMAGDEDVLDLLVNGEVFGVLWWQERQADYVAATKTSPVQSDDDAKQQENNDAMDKEVQDKLILATKPKDNKEMKAYLEAAERQKLLEGVTAMVLISLKST
ncbi:MAG: hypothetical protein AAF125_00110 [Chloroflexota bacterium]